MTNLVLMIDMVFITAIIFLAWRSLMAPDLFQAVVLFIAFGLFLALGWARLNAPDVALAEAAIGSGVTGALLLSALRRLESRSQPDRKEKMSKER